jgi:transcriptional regulator with XRE-family HTH domain
VTDPTTNLARLGAAIADVLKNRPREQGRTKQWLAEQVGVTGGHISRIVSGQIANVAVEMIRSIEDALDLPRGFLLRAGGYVEEATTLEGLLEADGSLSEAARTFLRTSLRVARDGGI